MVADECGNVLYSHSEILPFAQDINNSPKSLEINGNVTCVSGSLSWVKSDFVHREIEIKAVTLHELVFREINKGEIVTGVEPNIPTFEGPGWMAQVQ